jgi:hypothetical protein
MNKICENLNSKAMVHLTNLLAELEYYNTFVKQNYAFVLAFIRYPALYFAGCWFI